MLVKILDIAAPPVSCMSGLVHVAVIVLLMQLLLDHLLPMLSHSLEHPPCQDIPKFSETSG